MKQYDIAIIGAGPGGLYATYYAHLKGFKACLLEANNELGGQPSILFPVKSIHDYPGYCDISGRELMNKFIDQIQDKSNIFTNTVVKEIKKVDNKYQLITNNDTYEAKFVIIATGGGFFKFNKINGVESNKIHYCVKDLNVYKDKKVVIAGGGDSAIDWALEILKRNLTKDLSIVHRRDAFRATGSKVDLIRKYDCKLYLNKTSTVISNNQLELVDNVTNSKEVLDFDYLIVQYGQTYSLQDNALLKPFELDKSNKIITNSDCRTNVKNIYAIGNVSSYGNKPRLISIAVTDALKAIEDIAKEVAKYE